jgi:WXG100 family type VII secretion target
MAIQIKINFDDMGKYAQIINTESSDVQKLYNSLNGEADRLKASTFVGKTANAWHREIETDILPKLKHLSQVLVALSQLLQFLNKHYENEDRDWSAKFGGIEISVNV